MTYAASGVDISKEEHAISDLIQQIRFKRTGVGRPLGGQYAGLVDFGEHALVLCTDGVGSKVLIASALQKWDTVGIDCIAMNVNDALCVGAEPIAFVDYLAIDNPDPAVTREIGKGLAMGARQANISIVGGETASLPEIVNGFDLAGTCLAYVNKKDIITGEQIAPGDVLIGLASSGIHSNGYSLVRKIIEAQNHSYTDSFSDNRYPDTTIGEVLLTPTRIYVKQIMKLLKQVSLHGLAHITGGGLRNLLRLNTNVRYVIDCPLPPQPLFDTLQQMGKVDDKEMYQTFNMGMGFTIIVGEDESKKALSLLNRHSDFDVQVVGYIDKGKGVVHQPKNIEF